MRYTIQYVVVFPRGPLAGTASVYYPTVAYDENRRGGSVWFTHEIPDLDKSPGSPRPYTWATRKGAEKNIKRYRPSTYGTIISEIVFPYEQSYEEYTPAYWKGG